MYKALRRRSQWTPTVLCHHRTWEWLRLQVQNRKCIGLMDSWASVTSSILKLEWKWQGERKTFPKYYFYFSRILTRVVLWSVLSAHQDTLKTVYTASTGDLEHNLLLYKYIWKERWIETLSHWLIFLWAVFLPWWDGREFGLDSETAESLSCSWMPYHRQALLSWGSALDSTFQGCWRVEFCVGNAGNTTRN